MTETQNNVDSPLVHALLCEVICVVSPFCVFPKLTFPTLDWIDTHTHTHHTHTQASQASWYSYKLNFRRGAKCGCRLMGRTPVNKDLSYNERG